MKLSKLFHTLYATVMALPVLIIPIFALNILHKETEPISIEVQENINLEYSQYILNYNDVYEVPQSTTNLDIYVQYNLSFTQGHTYLLTWYQENDYTSIERNTPLWIINGSATYLSATSNYNKVEGQYSWRYTYQGINSDNVTLRYWINSPSNANALKNFNLFDLSEIYGVGNEINTETFLQYFDDMPYSYGLNKNILIPNVTTTYNDTDIGSQFVYALYKPVNDYFNFGEFFGLSGMYDWFQLNIFNGTAPLSFFIVFNVMIYWLFISLFWLLFDILIYVPMVIHKWLDKAEM